MIHPVDRFGILGALGQELCCAVRSGNAKWFKHAENTTLAAHDLLPGLKPRQFDGQGMLVATLFVRALSQSQATILLCRNGMPSEAKILLRCLIELTIYLRAIHADESFATHYIKQHDRERLRMASKIGRSEFLQSRLPSFNVEEERERGHQAKVGTRQERAVT